VFRIESLRPEHAPDLLAFERRNRAYFARSVPDRGDDYFASFDARHAALLAEQDQGVCRFHVVVDEAGAIIARVNLLDCVGGSAELGYRVAERAAGRGVATAAVREICGLAVAAYGLSALTAQTTIDNAGSRAVLARAGFVPTGPVTLSGRLGLRYAKGLTATKN
jgi:ribosomal-protein-alanine N-acetyltransferase